VSAIGLSSQEPSRDPKEDDKGETPDETIVNEAKRRFRRCSNWETDTRTLFVEDIKFDAADSDNMYQWDDLTQTARGVGTPDERPCLTTNKVRQHNLQIINDAKQNKPSVKVKPVGNGATYDSALVYSGVCEHIEYISNAQQAYDGATGFQVRGGIGWWRVVTDYSGDDSFDQEIFIRRVKDPLTIYMDPDIREQDGSDAKFAFIFDDMSRESFNEAYPAYKNKATKSPLGVTDDWVGEDKVRIAEYYRVVEESDKLVAYVDPATGQRVIERKSKIDKELFESVIDDPSTKLRDIVDRKVEWYMIVGNEIAERSVWPGKYIPLVRIIGEETIIDGQLDRKGHTRAMKDPQKIYNYWNSATVEQVALQTKIPYTAPVGAIEGLETYWETANTVNHSILPYNQFDDAGKEMREPKRMEPPSMAQAYIEGLKIASEQIKEVSGQYQAELGMEGNEKSGVAIQQRQRQGDNATYHYIDNLAIGIKFTGKILIDLIPKIYDTQRVIKIMTAEGKENEVTIDPTAQNAYSEQASSKDAIQSIFNPNVGKYDVEAEIGPDNGTQRQEAVKAFMALAQADPEILKIGGDIIVKMMDVPMADILAERIQRSIPPQILGEAPSQADQKAQQTIQEMGKELMSMQELLRKQSEALTAERSKVLVHQEQKDIDIYRAITDRLKILLPLVTSPADQARMAHDMMMAEHASDMNMNEASHASVLGILQAQAMPQQPDNDAGESGHSQTQPQPQAAE
jgi:portal protein